MRHGTRRFTTDKTRDRITETMRQAIADNLRIDVDRIRYAHGDGPGQFGESGMRWEIF